MGLMPSSKKKAQARAQKRISSLNPTTLNVPKVSLVSGASHLRCADAAGVDVSS